ncbi:6-hydroxymethylpterin diphosphokinase MptE-like protein [Mucilaginibacter segetis]|uniref:DUF115 domain-containing protein n=1 Tax=Mucilaginibacter segetis TaxID=2793071 RepID=A0A934PX75_9SPHI|nr:6-hydroxymethylpterin diphosphokinase MptE-like protein [Mucilaginibacter segetis]MBK0380683.1 DUF115 domain-containing protein [Mucilaginibacter segetis]
MASIIVRGYKLLDKHIKEIGIGGTFIKLFKQKTFNHVKKSVTRELTMNKRSLRNWKTLKGKYAGKRAFLLGNGPSLNKTALYLLKNEYTICFNRFNIMFERLSWKPTFYMNIDPLVAQDMANEINEITPQVKIAFFPDIHTNMLDFRKFIKDRENVQWMFPQYKGFYFDLPRVGLGGTVAFPALQVLTYLGFSEIYLIGVDMNYQIHKTVKDIAGTDVASTKDDDPNHFDPRYFGTGRKYHQPVPQIVNNIMNSFEFAADKIKQNTITKVYNAGIGSKVECFDKVKFENLFNFNEEEIYRLFSLSISNKCSPEKVKDYLTANQPEVEINADIAKEIFILEGETAISFIPKLVMRYLPYGPIEGKHLFIRRDVWDKVVREKLTN